MTWLQSKEEGSSVIRVNVRDLGTAQKEIESIAQRIYLGTYLPNLYTSGQQNAGTVNRSTGKGNNLPSLKM